MKFESGTCWKLPDRFGTETGKGVCLYQYKLRNGGGNDDAKNDEWIGIFSGCTSCNRTGLEFDTRSYQPGGLQ